MPKIFYPSSERLSYLLESIHNREMALPDFQRDFVWPARATEELIESLCQNFPAGSLLRIKNSPGFYFTPREFAGAPPLDGHSPSHILLDGQQRLTSLYQAMHGVGNHRYFADLQGLLEGDDLEDCVFHMRRDEATRHFGTISQQAESLVLPLHALLESAGGFEEWLDQASEFPNGMDADWGDLRKKLRRVRHEWLEPLEDYEFPMVTLSEDTSPLALCTIFEVLNRTGVKLSVFDLLAARLWPQGLRLRDLWDDALRRHPLVAEFEVDPYWVLQSVALCHSPDDGPPSCKRKDVLALDVEEVRKSFGTASRGLATALEMLRDRCGVFAPGLLPHNAMLIPLAAAFATAVPARGPAAGAALSKLCRWFWCSTFGQSYENAPNSRAATDFDELRRWVAGGEPPRSVADFTFQPEQLRRATPRERALYRGTTALALSRGARDLRTGKELTAAAIVKGEIDDRHVFSRAFLAKQNPRLDAGERDCVLNRVMMNQATGARASKSSPSRFLDEIEAEVGAATLKAALASQLLPAERGSGLRRDDFESFLAQRAKLVSEAISQVTR